MPKNAPLGPNHRHGGCEHFVASHTVVGRRKNAIRRDEKHPRYVFEPHKAIQVFNLQHESSLQALQAFPGV